MIISSDLIQIIIAVIVLQSMSIVFAGFLLIRMTAVLYRFKQTFDEEYLVEPDYGEMAKQTFDYNYANFRTLDGSCKEPTEDDKKRINELFGKNSISE